MEKETLGLKLSAIAFLGMAILGIFFAILTRSDAILLSGVFSLISFVIGLLTMKVAELVEGPDDEHFHFGYAFFEPFLNAIKGLLILIVCALALASAAGAILDGGRTLNASWALIYAVIAAVGCLAIALVERGWAKKTHSPLLEVDVKNWTLDFFVNAGVGAAFLIALWLGGTRWSHLVPYVDPVLLTLLVVALIWTPAKTVKDNVAELLQVAPSPSVQRDVHEKFDRAVEDLELEKSYLRMVKVGRYFYLLAQLVVPPTFRLNRVKELDDIRARIAEGVKDVHPRMVLDTLFTEKDPTTK